MGVQILQQQDAALKIQRAFRAQYTIPKGWRLWRLITTYVIALLFPIISFNVATEYAPTVKSWLAVVATLWTFAAFWIAHHEKKCFKRGAQLQDLFDTKVFSIGWNKILVGDQPSQETINRLSARFDGDVDLNWYGDLDGIPAPYDAVISQRSNVVWDWRLRQQYLNWLTGGLILLLIIQIVVHACLDLQLSDFLVAIFLPSLSAYTTGIRECFEHWDNIQGKKSLERKITTVLEEAVRSGNDPDKFVIREIQDTIYILRRCTATIPDFFWSIHRKKYNETMQEIVDGYKQQIDNYLKK